jgi:uncharacterized protein (TIGR03067 family)
MPTRIVACSFLLAAAVLATPAARAQEDGLAGSWVAIEAQRNGVAAPDLLGHELTLTADQFEIIARGQPLYAGTYAADPTTYPAHIDFDHEVGALVGQTWEGIYRLEGRYLLICDDAADTNSVRPEDFATAPGSGYVMITFERRG